MTDTHHEATELTCLDCRFPYKDFALDVLVSDELWATITGSDGGGGGVLCANCICKRVVGAGLGVTHARLRFPDLEKPDPQTLRNR